MSKDVDNLIKFLDENGPKVFDALNSDKVEFDRVMDSVFKDFLNVNIGSTPRKARAHKRKVRRGIGSY